VANVRQSTIIQQNLLQYESGNGFAQFAATLHDAQTQWNNFSGQQEGDDFLFVSLNECANHSQAGQSQVLKGASFRGCVKEGIEEQRYMGL
jgi:hypothetical protein